MWAFFLHTKIQVVIRRFLERGRLDGVGQEAEDGAEPQQHGKATEESLQELDPFRCRRRRGQGVGTVPLKVGLGLGGGEAGVGVDAVPLEEVLDGQLVVVHLELLLEVVKLPVFACN